MAKRNAPKSKIPYILTLIAAIIDLIAGIVIFIVSLFVILLGSSVPNIVSDLSEIPLAPVIAGVILIIASLVVIAIAILLLVASTKMRDSKDERGWGILTIIIGAITIGQVSGILALVGGIIYLIDSHN